MSFRTFGLNLQLILVIVATATIISVVDNILDAQREARESEERRSVSAEIDKQEKETQQKILEHVEQVNKHANTTQRTYELQLETLDQLRNQTSTTTTTTR